MLNTEWKQRFYMYEFCTDKSIRRKHVVNVYQYEQSAINTLISERRFFLKSSIVKTEM